MGVNHPPYEKSGLFGGGPEVPHFGSSKGDKQKEKKKGRTIPISKGSDGETVPGWSLDETRGRNAVQIDSRQMLQALENPAQRGIIIEFLKQHPEVALLTTIGLIILIGLLVYSRYDAATTVAANMARGGGAPGETSSNLQLPPEQTEALVNSVKSVLMGTPDSTLTITVSPSPTLTETPADTDTPSFTPSETPSDEPSATTAKTEADVVIQKTKAPVETPTYTPTFLPPTETPTIVITRTRKPSETPTEEPATDTPSYTPSETPTDTPTDEPTQPDTDTPTAADTATLSGNGGTGEGGNPTATATPMEVAMVNPVDIHNDAVFKEAYNALQPQMLFLDESGKKVTLKKTDITFKEVSNSKGNSYYGYDKDGKVRLMYEKGIDVLNDWVLVTYSTAPNESLIPQYYGMTPDESSLSRVAKFNAKLGKPGEEPPFDTIAYVGPSTKEDIASGPGSYTSGDGFTDSINGAPPLRPIGSAWVYGDPYPGVTNGTQVTDALAIYGAYLATGQKTKDLPTLREMIKKRQAEVQLSDGETWNPADGIFYVETGSMNQEELDKFKSNDVKTYVDFSTFFVRPDGKLVIRTFIPHHEAFRDLTYMRVVWSKIYANFPNQDSIETSNHAFSTNPMINQIITPYLLDGNGQIIALINPFHIKSTAMGKSFDQGAPIVDEKKFDGIIN